MSDPITISEYDFAVVSDMEKTQSKPQPDTPFRILLLGDFGGRTRRGAGESARLRPVALDRDNIDALLARLQVEIALPLAGRDQAPLIIRFAEMDDFHPDRLYQRLEIFAELREMREALADPAALAAFTDELRQEPPAAEQPEMPPLQAPQEGGGLLDQIIDQTAHPAASRTASPRPGSQLDSFVRQLVRPHLLARAKPKQQEMLDAVDRAAAELLRLILNHPRFQAMEAAWRGLDFLASRLETDEQLGIYLLDLSREELAADLAGDDLRRSAICRLLVEEALHTPGGVPWAVVAGCYTLDKTLADIGLLARLARIAEAAGAPFIAAASDHMLCGQSLHQTPDPDDWRPRTEAAAEEAWQLLRSLPEAQYLGLVLPRLLLRLPYGADSDPLDSLSFEELDAEGGHENYLWGNPVLACALLLGQAFSRQGWRMQPGEVDEINSLPLPVYQQDGESRTKPCAEVVLTQRAAERIMEAGLMPLLSFVNQDRVRLARFQSIAEPLTRLAGPWS
ncbi:MAG: type VI secretion system contractile sheath large subunit [Thermodesulfobacteriota bacterium]